MSQVKPLSDQTAVRMSTLLQSANNKDIYTRLMSMGKATQTVVLRSTLSQSANNNDTYTRLTSIGKASKLRFVGVLCHNLLTTMIYIPVCCQWERISPCQS